MVKARSFWRETVPETTAHETLRRWSFYTAWPLLSNNSVRTALALPRLKNFGHNFVRNAGNWPAMGDGCGCKGMASTTVKSAD